MGKFGMKLNLVLISYIVVSMQIFNKVFRTSKMVIDEEFHLRQGLHYCNKNFSVWDPKITTFPGLYVVSTLLFGFINSCSVYHLRLTNLISSVVNVILIYKIREHFYKGPNTALSKWNLTLETLTIAILPPMYFFSFVYYTDIISITFVLAMTYFNLKNRVVSSSFMGVCSVAMRQTNIVWVGVVFGSNLLNDITQNRYKKLEEHFTVKENVSSLGDIIKCVFTKPIETFWEILSLAVKFSGYILIFISFIVFLFYNGSISVGDKSAHEAKLHLPQDDVDETKSCLPMKSAHIPMPVIDKVCSTDKMKSLTKMYLIICLSTACIFLYQFQVSNSSWQPNNLQNLDAGVELDVQPVPVKVAEAPLQPPIAEPKTSHIQTDPSSKSSSTEVTSSTTLNVTEIPPIYIITPTFRRPEQLAELTRFGYTLKHVKNLFWIVVEDANQTTPLVSKLLEKIGIPFAHLIAPMPDKFRRNKIKPRGVSNRNRGLAWIRANATDGAFYFADDDNTYDPEIFEQIRYTKKVSMFPVGLVTKLGLSSPIVKNGKFAGYYDGWVGGRKYPLDMAGFAVGVKFLLSRPNATMPFKPGYEEDGFIKSLEPFSMDEVQFLASNCTEILTWHTQTKKNTPALKENLSNHTGTNLIKLGKILV